MDKELQHAGVRHLIAGYLSDQTVLDECFQKDEVAKDYWKQLLSNIDQLGTAELRSRQQELLKILQENGVTYNVYGDSNGINRPWLLDTIPLVISAAEWRGVERGMKQRAHVLNKILEDLYGERTLLRKASHEDLTVKCGSSRIALRRHPGWAMPLKTEAHSAGSFRNYSSNTRLPNWEGSSAA